MKILEAEIDVPYKDGIITFIYPAYGPDTYQNVMNQISLDGLLRPTSAQTISLLDLALQNRDELKFRDVLTKFAALDCDGLWVATENLCIPRKSIIVYDNIDGKMPQTSKELLEMYEAKDPRVRPVSYEFKREYQDIDTFFKNPYANAHFEEQIYLATIVAARIRDEPEVNVDYSVDIETKRYTTLSSLALRGGLTMHSYNEYTSDAYAFGLLKNGR